MKQLSKKGQVVSSLQGFVMAIVTIAVVLAIGLYVLQEVETSTMTGANNNVSTAASNATGDIIEKLGNAPTWLGLLIVVVFATAILAYFYMRG